MAHQELAAKLADLLSVTPEAVLKMLTTPKSVTLGDVALPCFPFAKAAGKRPDELAAHLADTISLPEAFESVKATGPYLNFSLKRGVFAKSVIAPLLTQKLDAGKAVSNNRRVLVEYSSPNIAKIFHVGHLRTTLIGHSLYRVFKHRGYEVVGINHLGDWGTQFGFVWAGKQLWGLGDNPSVDDLVDIYVRASSLRKAQEKDEVSEEDQDKPDVNSMAREYFLRLEADEPEAVAFWQWCLDLSLVYFKRIYQRLGITFDHYTGESFYRDQLSDVENAIRESGVLENSEGAQGVDLGKDLGFARIFTQDGRSLYITRDIAAALYRHKTFAPEKTLYVVGSAQSLHFKQLVGVLKCLKHPAASEIVHVPFGNVPGMSTRTGGAISLEGFLSEAKDRALTAYREEVSKRPEGLDEDEVAEQVAIGATYFYFLSHTNTKDFQFSWKEALNFQGDSGPYLQYALGRLYGIERRVKAEKISLEESCIDFSCLQEDASHELVMLLARFESTLNKVVETYEPVHLASYVLELARTFSKSYQKLRVLGEEEKVAHSRLALFRAVRYVLHASLYLIGVPPVERM